MTRDNFNYPHKATRRALRMEPKKFNSELFKRCEGCLRLKSISMFITPGSSVCRCCYTHRGRVTGGRKQDSERFQKKKRVANSKKRYK